MTTQINIQGVSPLNLQLIATHGSTHCSQFYNHRLVFLGSEFCKPFSMSLWVWLNIMSMTFNHTLYMKEVNSFHFCVNTTLFD